MRTHRDTLDVALVADHLTGACLKPAQVAPHTVDVGLQPRVWLLAQREVHPPRFDCFIAMIEPGRQTALLVESVRMQKDGLRPGREGGSFVARQNGNDRKGGPSGSTVMPSSDGAQSR